MGFPFPVLDRHAASVRSEEHTSELQSQSNLVCRLLLEKKKIITISSSGNTSLISVTFVCAFACKVASQMLSSFSAASTSERTSSAVIICVGSPVLYLT